LIASDEALAVLSLDGGSFSGVRGSVNVYCNGGIEGAARTAAAARVNAGQALESPR
jgi:hypothetical protein